MSILHSNHMTKNDIRAYILLDRELTQMKRDITGNTKLKHHFDRDDIRHIRNSLKNLGVIHEDFGYNLSFDLVHAEMDNETWKCFVPEHLSDEDKRELEDGMWIHCRPSQYDCTGQRFTHFIDFYEVPAGTWIYHRLGYDY